jgi:hypothetical protein
MGNGIKKITNEEILVANKLREHLKWDSANLLKNINN